MPTILDGNKTTLEHEALKRTPSGETAKRVCIDDDTPVPIKNQDTTPAIVNVTSPGTSDTEFSIAIADGTNQFTIRARGSSRLKLAYVSAGDFITIPLGGWYRVEGLYTSSVTLVLKCSKASQIIEVETWT